MTSRGFMSLNKRDVQLFFKRLRKLSDKRIREHYYKLHEGKIKKSKIKVYANVRYYLAGEYGTKYGRPHYHIILYGAEQQDVVEAWLDPKTKKPIGIVHFGYDTSEAAIGYTLKYLAKEKKIPVHANDDRQPEFALMSKGLGKNYINANTIKYHRQDIRANGCITLKDGKRIGIPRYYKDKLYTKEQIGYLKGYYEREANRKDAELRAKTKRDIDWYIVQSHLAAFRKMYHREKENRTL